jgi:hypothetical protein
VQYIVLDHVERIATADVLPVLLRAREMAGAALGLVLVSQVAWGLNVFEYDTLPCPKPHQLCFPAYRMQDLLSVRAPNPAMLADTPFQIFQYQLTIALSSLCQWTIVLACKGASANNSMGGRICASVGLGGCTLMRGVFCRRY